MRLPFAVCQFLKEGVTILAVSDGFCELFGYKDREQAYSDMNLNMFKNIHHDDTARFTNAILRFGTEGGRLEVVYRTKKRDGSGYRVVRLAGEHVHAGEEWRLAHVWFADEGDYREESGANPNCGHNGAHREETFEGIARYDYLTGLPNMTYLFERAEIGRKRILDQGGLPALLYIDLAGMKSYNH